MPILALLVSYIPAFVFYFWFKSLKQDKEYKDNCRKLLLLGIASSAGVVLFSLVASLLWGLSGLDEISSILDEAFSAFILAALSEEFVKGFVARKNIQQHRATVFFHIFFFKMKWFIFTFFN